MWPEGVNTFSILFHVPHVFQDLRLFPDSRSRREVRCPVFQLKGLLSACSSCPGQAAVRGCGSQGPHHPALSLGLSHPVGVGRVLLIVPQGFFLPVAIRVSVLAWPHSDIRLVFVVAHWLFPALCQAL